MFSDHIKKGMMSLQISLKIEEAASQAQAKQISVDIQELKNIIGKTKAKVLYWLLCTQILIKN